ATVVRSYAEFLSADLASPTSRPFLCYSHLSLSTSLRVSFRYLRQSSKNSTPWLAATASKAAVTQRNRASTPRHAHPGASSSVRRPAARGGWRVRQDATPR